MNQVISQLQQRAADGTTRGLCILSLDGGGVRGLSALYILKAVMARVNNGRKHVGLPSVKPYEIFDLIGGTSTGGIIAIMLGRLEMDVEECIAIYRALISKIFKRKKSKFGVSLSLELKAKYSSEILEKEIKNTINSREGFSEDDNLNNERDGGCRVFVCAVAKETKGVARLKSYTIDGEAAPSVPPKIWQAALATSAATHFFDSVKIGARTYVDGGLQVNNPIDEVEQEARDIWCPDTDNLKSEVATFISIGTGNPGKKPIEDNGLKFLSETLVEIATETEKTAKRFANQWRSVLGEKYFRLNVDQGLQDVGLEEYLKEDIIEAATAEYLDEAQQVAQLKKIEGALKWKESCGYRLDIDLTIWSIRTLDNPTRIERLLNRPEWNIVNREFDNRNIFDRISQYEPDRICRRYVRMRCPRTADWALTNPDFLNWATGSVHPGLCLSGPVGSGKTLVTSTIVEQLPKLCPNTFVGHFFYDCSQENSLRAQDAFSSFAKQIIIYLDAIGRTCSLAVIDAVKRYFGPNKPAPSFGEIIDDLFVPLCKQLGAGVFVVDGLDLCDQAEVFKALKVWKQFTPTAALRWLVSARESVEQDFKALYKGAQLISVPEVSNREDIKNFIDWKINELQAERTLTKDERLLDEYFQSYDHANLTRILWVSLQLDALWTQCSTDSDIQSVLKKLPQDLDETYDRCLRWIALTERFRRLALRILTWVCEAPRPFKLGELKEALAIDMTTGSLRTDNLTSESEIVKSCGNLIRLHTDEGGYIKLTHHSALLFLRSRLADGGDLFVHGERTEQEILPLGNMCMIHLQSPDYTRALQPYQSSVHDLRINPFAIVNNSELPALARWLFSTYSSSSAVIRVADQTRKPKKGKEDSFFHFAREQWVSLTTELTTDSLCWSGFRDLALQPNESWKMHPWSADSNMDSHLSGLLGWSIIKSHLALMQLMLDFPRSTGQVDRFNSPMSQYNDMLPLHLAALKGRRRLMQMLLDRCKTKVIDEQGRTLMHYAAQNESPEILLLLYEKNIKPLEARDRRGQTPLAIAAGEGNEATVLALLDLKADTSTQRDDGLKPWEIAFQNGHDATARHFPEWPLQQGELADVDSEPELCRLAAAGDRAGLLLAIANGADIDVQGRLRRTPLMSAVLEDHEEIARELLNRNADVNAKCGYDRTALMCSAAKGMTDLVRNMLKAGADANAVDIGNRSALDEALCRGYTDVVETLIEFGVTKKSVEDASPSYWS